MSASISEIPELTIQKVVHRIISDPSDVLKTESGKRLQVLSPGTINVKDGPDFVDIAVLLDSTIYVGNAEYHRKSSEWENHLHHKDNNYNSVILHIVSENNSKSSYPFETLIIPENLIIKYYHTLKDEEERGVDIQSVEDLQDYALNRILRKSAEAQILLNCKDIKDVTREITYNFINRYNKKQRRPIYSKEQLEKLLLVILESNIYYFLDELYSGHNKSIPDRMYRLLKEKISDEGDHLRREIILNCVLPLALCLANDEARIGLFLWFWSTPAICQYGLLKRKFANIPQNFLWQQQGMLEYLKEHGEKKNLISESIKAYGFSGVLSFYKVGKMPLGGDIYDN